MNERWSRGPVAVLGFGNQGEAQALNLRDSGIEVVVGARPGHPAAERARAHGFRVLRIAEAVRTAPTAVVLLPDEVVPSVWPDLESVFPASATIVFAHGFNLLYGNLPLPPASDVVLVSPTGPGHVVRALYERGQGLPAYLAVQRDATGQAWNTAEAYAHAIGCGRARLWRTTVREETEVDLFGEQAVLCGGMNALVTAAFEILVERGYAPEIAYLECVHQLKYLADLLHERGIAGLRRGISGTALFGDLTRGPRVVGEASRAEMARVLEEIRSGVFAREWTAEFAAGRRRLDALAEQAAWHPIERARAIALGSDAAPGAQPENRARPCPKTD
jgi:ketol-acid reductoisomerase